MNVVYSPTAGVLVSSGADQSSPEVHYLTEQSEGNDVENLYALSTIQDWEIPDSNGNDLVAIIQHCTSDYWTTRSQSLIICLIEGVSDSLALEVLEHVESIIQSRPSADDVINRLLIAPIREPQRVKALTALALSHGFATVGSLLDRLFDLQVLLKRFVEVWLSFPADEFTELPVPREAFWRSLSRRGLLSHLLEAPNRVTFTSTWAALAFDELGVAGRQSVMRIGNLLADTLYPASTRTHGEIEHSHEEEQTGDQSDWGARRDDFPSYEAFQRALKQVKAIVDEVARGHDSRAKRFLRELIADQSRHGDREYVLKSLCNIAQKCAHMFRADFERQCLNEALSIAPDDAWTLIQMGNHLKRVGEFEEAIRILRKAAALDSSTVAISSIADVWCEYGDYEKAMAVYQELPGGQDLVEVRTGMADIKRYKGQFSEAMAEYDTILAKWNNADRAIAGKAEIYKRWGRYDEAIAAYDSLIYAPPQDVDEIARVIYRLGKCAVLKHSNQLTEAYGLADDVVRMAPFFMLARVYRASILALLGDEAKGLASLPESSLPQAYGTWIAEYCRGLLLLKLERYPEARSLLVDRLKSALLTSDDKTILRLGAAFAFLCEGKVDNAASILSEIQDVRDFYTEYVFQVLELHLSVVRHDNKRTAEIEKRLDSVRDRDPVVANFLSALWKGDFSAVRSCELELLLRIAA